MIPNKPVAVHDSPVAGFQPAVARGSAVPFTRITQHPSGALDQQQSLFVHRQSFARWIVNDLRAHTRDRMPDRARLGSHLLSAAAFVIGYVDGDDGGHLR